MILILWIVTAAIGTVVSALQTVDLARRWLRIRQHDDNGVKPVLLTMAALTGTREALRFLASLGLLVVGLISLDRIGAPVTFAVVVVFFANWVYAVNSVLERVQARAEDQYIDIEAGHVRTPAEVQEHKGEL